MAFIAIGVSCITVGVIVYIYVFDNVDYYK